MILINLRVKGPGHLHPQDFMNRDLHGRADDVARLVKMPSINVPFVTEKSVKVNDHLTLFIVTDASLSADEFGEMIEGQ